jgi:subtilisin family serine protease
VSKLEEGYMSKGFRAGHRTAIVLGALAAFAALLLTTAASAAADQRQNVIIGYAGSDASARALVSKYGGSVKHGFPSINALAASLDSVRVADLAREGGVRYVENDAPRTALGLSELDNSQLVPASSNGLYGLVMTKEFPAPLGYTGAGAMACIADTGIDVNHPDIKGNFLGGYDAIDLDNSPNVGNDIHEQHATHVSGTVAGVDNGKGVVGGAPGNAFLEARVLHWDGTNNTGETSQVMAGAQWLADHGCRVINMSLGGGSKSRAEEALYDNLFKNGTGGKGTLIVASAGNDAARTVSYPAAYTNVLSVAALNPDGSLASFSNRGSALDISAPGVNVVSSVPTGTGRDAAVGNIVGPEALSAEFGGATSAQGVTGTLVDCGLALTADACPAGVAGNIALISRGSATFAAKVENAMARGAAAAVIYNNVAGTLSATLGTETTSTGKAWIPVVTVPQAQGATLVSQAGSTTTVFSIPTSWDYFSGTSMAAPHVTAAAALVLSANPRLNPAQLTDILTSTATDLGARGSDNTFGSGLVNADAAVRKALATP